MLADYKIGLSLRFSWRICMNYFITGTRRGLGKALLDKYGTVNKLEECDVFINCKHEGFNQIELLYKAAEFR